MDTTGWPGECVSLLVAISVVALDSRQMGAETRVSRTGSP